VVASRKVTIFKDEINLDLFVYALRLKMDSILYYHAKMPYIYYTTSALSFRIVSSRTQ